MRGAVAHDAAVRHGLIGRVLVVGPHCHVVAVRHIDVARNQDVGVVVVRVIMAVVGALVVRERHLVGGANARVPDEVTLLRGIEQAVIIAARDAAHVVVVGVLGHPVEFLVAADDPALDGVLDVIARVPYGIECDAELIISGVVRT